MESVHRCGHILPVAVGIGGERKGVSGEREREGGRERESSITPPLL